MSEKPNMEQLIHENYFLKSKLEEILKEHARPHESGDVYAANIGLLLQSISKELENKSITPMTSMGA